MTSATHVILHISSKYHDYFYGADISVLRDIDPRKIHGSSPSDRARLQFYLGDETGNLFPEWQEFTNDDTLFEFQRTHHCLFIACDAY